MAPELGDTPIVHRRRMATMLWMPSVRASRVELEQHDVAVLDDIFLAFIACLAGFLGRYFAAQRDEVVVGDGLGADEAAFEIGVDDAGGLGGLVALVDGPGARL